MYPTTFITTPSVLVVPKPCTNIRAPRRPRMALAPQSATLKQSLAAWGVQIDRDNTHNAPITPISIDPPLIRVQNFITPSQCDAIIDLQRGRTDESDLYLNYRVNKQVSQSGQSEEAQQLIAEFNSAADALADDMRSGFRVPIDPAAEQLRPVLDRVRALFGWHDKQFVFEEGAWIRPSRRTVVVRDATTVHYQQGEGVAPHVDGKDLTVLICLQQPDRGGRTVFPEDDIAVIPTKGAAILYKSQKELLHFAESVLQGEKWVLQLLIDFRVRADEMDVDYTSGQVFHS